MIVKQNQVTHEIRILMTTYDMTSVKKVFQAFMIKCAKYSPH